jgi:hypothetical protein
LQRHTTCPESKKSQREFAKLPDVFKIMELTPDRARP